MLVAESEAKKHEKERVVNECFPPLQLSGLSVQELQVLAQQIMLIWSLFYIFWWFFFFSLQDLCKELHRKIDVVDEARYDMEVKVSKNDQEVQ